MNQCVSEAPAAAPGEAGRGLVLGEHVWDGLLGRRVLLCYGSFAALLGDGPRWDWERELRRTVRHELRCLESPAGADETQSGGDR